MKRLGLALLNFTISSAFVIGFGIFLTPYFDAPYMEGLEIVYGVLFVVWLLLLFIGFKATQQFLDKPE